ncbi:MAG: septal ring lytic transglycosylase RlpA family protein [Acidimicrobiales bacterium]|nr:septal ring lytic transglycosylase RlpA family protein [Hyphomonadaceae bacterium]RZV36310.1 MAG: septal ring lytic transglycosylase RlpA family protein [Acidimicrobiales bacterium]
MGKSYTPKHQPGYDKTGTASWYGDKFHGKPTATGEPYDMNDITAAHKTLPLNSMVFVTNLETGNGMMVRVNDRGPFVDGRIIDLSRASAKALGLFSSGLAKVRVQYAGPADPMAAKSAIAPAPRPVAPVYEQDEEPALVVETPNYQPLRDLGEQSTTPAAPVALPQQQFPFQPVTPQQPRQDWRNAVPQTVLPESPQAVQSPQGDEPVTLTITGPVHLASDKSDPQAKAKFIPAVNYREIPAKK